jgi:nucleoside-diphosphate-sugar epimerase
MNKKKVLVTGGAGFIGSHLVERLVREGYKVVVVDNLSEGKLKNLSSVTGLISFHKVDIRNLKKLNSSFKGADTVFHLAALRSVKRSVDDPIATNENNITGTLNVLTASRDQGVRRVILASSSSVYGPQKEKIFTEDLTPNPKSPYALSKLTGEIYCKQFFKLYGLETISLRFFNVFGPRQDPESEYAAVIPKFITKLIKGEKATIEWDGKQSRDFTYVDNVVEANILAMKSKKAEGRVINVSEGKSVYIIDLYDLLQKIIGKQIKPSRGPKRAGDMRYTCGSTLRAKKLLAYSPQVSFQDGLRRTIKWFQEY